MSDQSIINGGNRGQFTTLDNSEIRDRRLSLSAKGLHHLMQSLPSQSATITELAAMAPDSESEIESYLDELESVGYVTRTGNRYQVGGAA